MRNYTITPTIFGRWFGNLKWVCFDESTIQITKNSVTKIIPFADIIHYPKLKRGVFSDQIIIRTRTEMIVVKGLSKKHRSTDVMRLMEVFSTFFEVLVADCALQIHELAENKYLRDSNIEHLEALMNPIIDSYNNAKAIVVNHQCELTLDAIEFIATLSPLSQNKERLREQFEKNSFQQKKEFFRLVESNPLTVEQSLSVIRDNDRNLVLAAAGTGKTSVMVAKALDIIASDLAKPEEVLVLAFAKSAAKELNARIETRRKAVLSKLDLPAIDQANVITASTFHSLGRKILQECSLNTSISRFAEDSKFKLHWIQNKLIEHLMKDTKNLHEFIDLLYPVSDPFAFKTNEEYQRYVRDNEYRTLSGDLVRSYQEVLIGNWLYLNGIPFEYEANYRIQTRVEIGHNYKPDFHILNTNIYIEHYGIDRQGNTRKDIDSEEYNNSIKKKRLIHEDNGTELIETFHYEWCEETLLTGLKEKLSQLDIHASPIPIEQVFEVISSLGMVTKFSEIVSQSIDAMRTENLSIDQARKRLGDISYSNIDKFTSILDILKKKYEDEMKQKGEIDFDDMILQAITCIKSGAYKPSWKYILVDEFQDISQSRMELVQALLDAVAESSLLAVGDDWQSIYRFSGGKLELTTRFNEYIGSYTETKLQKTFRYNNSIADTAGRFIMQNPEQYEKHIETHDVVNKSQIFLIDDSAQNKHKSSRPLTKVVNKILANDPNGSIAILGRYNYVLNQAKEELSGTAHANNINFWTFHRSKGLEADYCILTGFSQGKLGFPNENKDHEIVEALLPSLDTYPHSEERRLMYVALTRARKKAYIIADPLIPSLFVDELIVGGYDVVYNSDSFQERHRKIFKCHKCNDGYLIRKEKFDKPYYACSTYPGCNVITQSCPDCGAPMKDDNKTRTCNNPECNHVTNLCPECHRPLVLRKGKHGQFWGCSGYGAPGKDQCKYTQKI